MRQEVVDFIQLWAEKTPFTREQVLVRVGLPPSKYHDWVQRYVKENRHNAQIPKQIWLQKAEKEAVLDYYKSYPDEGYRRLA